MANSIQTLEDILTKVNEIIPEEFVAKHSKHLGVIIITKRLVAITPFKKKKKLS